MIKRERFHCGITGVSELLERLYEEYPEHRGSPPNRIFNLAVRDWLIQKLEEKDLQRMHQKLNKPRVTMASESREKQPLVDGPVV